MAEGGTDSSLLRNNLVGNQKEKTMEEKVVNPSTGYPEVPYTLSHQSPPSRNNLLALAHPHSPLHYYSQHSETELKAQLNGPTLTPWSSAASLEQVVDSKQQAGSLPQSSHGPPSQAAQASPSVESDDNSNSPTSNIAHGDEDGGAGSSFTSSYVRCADSSSSTQGAISTPTFESTPANLQNNSIKLEGAPINLHNNPTKLEGTPINLHNTPTNVHNNPTKLDGTPANLHNYPDKANNLSADTSRPAAQEQQPGFFHGAMPSGVMSSPGGFLPNMMYYPLPVGYMQGGQPSVMPMMAPTFGSVAYNAPYFPPGGAMSYPMAHPLMMPNISYPTNLGQTASPLTASPSGGASQPTLDSRNIPAHLQGPSPPSSGDDNSSGTHQSYSINPTNSTRLIRLRKPILEWLRRKLDQGCMNNWEAVADARGMNYEDIRAHLTDCRHNRESPFMKLLETEEFHAYTVGEFLEDVKSIKRKDILMDFDSVVRNNKG